jgi:hypothetical protein
LPKGRNPKMHDPVGLFFSSVNVALSILVLGMVAYGVNYFKSGLLAKTMSRARLVAILLLLYFSTQALIAIDFLPSNTPVDDVLGTLFMVSMIYLTYNFINDWKALQLDTPKEN